MANDDVIRDVQDFLGRAYPADQAKADEGMRKTGRSVGMFILGLLDAGVDTQVAIYEGAALIKCFVERSAAVKQE